MFRKGDRASIAKHFNGTEEFKQREKNQLYDFCVNQTIHIHIMAYHKPEFMFSLVVETFNKAFGLREESPSQVMRLSSRDLFTIQRKSFNNARQNDKIF